MKYRLREEVVNGDSPYVYVKLNDDGTQAEVTIQYCRTRQAKDVKTTTFGSLELGWLELDDLACVGRTIAVKLKEARVLHEEYVAGLMTSIHNELNA